MKIDLCVFCKREEKSEKKRRKKNHTTKIEKKKNDVWISMRMKTNKNGELNAGKYYVRVNHTRNL